MIRLLFASLAFSSLAQSPASSQEHDFEIPMSCSKTFSGDRGVDGNPIICDDETIEEMLEEAVRRGDTNEYRYMGEGIICMVDKQYPEKNGTLFFVIGKGKEGEWLPFRMYGSDDVERAKLQGWVQENALGELFLRVSGNHRLVVLHEKAREYITGRGYPASVPGAQSCTPGAMS